MNLLPLTPEGVEEKQQQLYKLSDRELLTQAGLLAADCRKWLGNNFDLSASQKEYLDSVPEIVNFSWGATFAAVIIVRGKIIMAPLPEYSTMERPKQIKVESEGDTEYDPENAAARKAPSVAAASITWKTE